MTLDLNGLKNIFLSELFRAKKIIFVVQLIFNCKYSTTYVEKNPRYGYLSINISN